MDIRYALLGFLSWRPFTGYELKKLIAESSFLYWSGNSNQIYRTLLEIHQEELVSLEVQPQEHLPARKIYSITERGRAELRSWLVSTPEAPELRNTFLIQLAWSEPLSTAELLTLVDGYTREVQMQLAMAQEERRRNAINPARTPREAYIWEMIAENRIGFYRQEINWACQLRQGIRTKEE